LDWQCPYLVLNLFFHWDNSSLFFKDRTDLDLSSDLVVFYPVYLLMGSSNQLQQSQLHQPLGRLILKKLRMQ
jgi:hypothetical protein